MVGLGSILPGHGTNTVSHTRACSSVDLLPVVVQMLAAKFRNAQPNWGRNRNSLRRVSAHETTFVIFAEHKPVVNYKPARTGTFRTMADCIYIKDGTWEATTDFELCPARTRRENLRSGLAYCLVRATIPTSIFPLPQQSQNHHFDPSTRYDGLAGVPLFVFIFQSIAVALLSPCRTPIVDDMNKDVSFQTSSPPLWNRFSFLLFLHLASPTVAE
jgi:hypothetical protein